jgi:hypothetical protein
LIKEITKKNKIRIIGAIWVDGLAFAVVVVILDGVVAELDGLALLDDTVGIPVEVVVLSAPGVVVTIQLAPGIVVFS